MEIALLAGKWLLVVGIYLFVWLVYRGLIAEAHTEREEESARLARATVPRMSAPTPLAPEGAPRRTPFSAEDRRGRTVPAGPPAPAFAPPVAVAPPVITAAQSAASVRSTLAEETEEPPIPALLARELPLDIARAEGMAPEPELEEEMPPPPLPSTPPAAPEPATMVVGSSTPRLVVLRSESVDLPPGREFPLLAAATIGRAEHNLVVLPDTFVSSQHALIFLKEGRRVLRDRGSTNGTLVNGHRVSGDHILRDGDQIGVGTSVLRYVEPE
jgi:hypothetical protein